MSMWGRKCVQLSYATSTLRFDLARQSARHSDASISNQVLSLLRIICFDPNDGGLDYRLD